MAEHDEWHGHRLSVLPPGESWLDGGERPQPTIDDLLDLPADFDQPPESAPRSSETPVASPVRGASPSRRGMVLLTALGLSALITIVVAHRSGPADPAPLPEQPGHVITSLARGEPTPLRVHVGDYVTFALPGGLTYSPIVEQRNIQSPVVEALDLPGQQPQLRADTTGHALVEVMSEPTCPAASACPDLRKVAGSLNITVVP